MFFLDFPHLCNRVEREHKNNSFAQVRIELTTANDYVFDLLKIILPRKYLRGIYNY